MSKCLTTQPFLTGNYFWQSLYVAGHIERGNIQFLQKMLDANPNLINWRDEWGNSLLHIAVQEKQPELVNLLIAAGCDINARDEIGETPLHVAAFFPSKSITEILIQAGADTNAVDIEGSTPAL